MWALLPTCVHNKAHLIILSGKIFSSANIRKLSYASLARISSFTLDKAIGPKSRFI